MPSKADVMHDITLTSLPSKASVMRDVKSWSYLQNPMPNTIKQQDALTLHHLLHTGPT